MKARQWQKDWQYGGIGIDLLPYQLAVGLSLRVFEERIAFRLYLGPVKILGSIALPLACMERFWRGEQKGS